jgi:hypothetical protein
VYSAKHGLDYPVPDGFFLSPKVSNVLPRSSSRVGTNMRTTKALVFLRLHECC